MDRLLTPPRAQAAVPDYVEARFSTRGWEMRPYQRKMIRAFAKRQSTLLVAPTGGGKTLSGFLPSLTDIHETRPTGLHTLYTSPLKALANDIERNLIRPIAEMGLGVKVESRTAIPHPRSASVSANEGLLLMPAFGAYAGGLRTADAAIVGLFDPAPSGYVLIYRDKLWAVGYS